MRDIKFRGKRLDNDEWVYGNLLNNKIYGCFIVGDFETVYDSAKDYFVSCNTSDEIDPKTLGQYTGLKDKNGKKIFEGDILYLNELQGKRKVYYPFNDNCAEYGLENIENGFKGTLCNSNRWENIGNIHDNPELLDEN